MLLRADLDGSLTSLRYWTLALMAVPLLGQVPPPTNLCAGPAQVGNTASTLNVDGVTLSTWTCSAMKTSPVTYGWVLQQTAPPAPLLPGSAAMLYFPFRNMSALARRQTSPANQIRDTPTAKARGILILTRINHYWLTSLTKFRGPSLTPCVAAELPITDNPLLGHHALKKPYHLPITRAALPSACSC